MSTPTTLFGSAEAQAARALVGGTTLGYNRNDLLKQILVATANRTGGTSGAAWGAITGTLSAQTDLQTALDAKLNKAGGAFTGLTGAGFRDTSAVFDVTLGFTSSVVLDAARALTIDVGNVAHTIALGTTAGTITFPNAAAVTVAGLQIANVFTAAQTINAGTLTTAALTLTQTWNNSGVTCRGIEYAATNTNSAADSTLLRLLGGAAGATAKLAVTQDARVCTEVGGAFPQFTGLGYTGNGMRVAADRVDFWLYGSVVATLTSVQLGLNDKVLSFRTGGSTLSEASNVLSLVNNTTAQKFRVFGTTTGSKYAQLEHDGTNAKLNSSSGDLHISSLPTANPGPGILWNNAGTPAIGT